MGYAPITTSVLAGAPPTYNDGGGDGSAGGGGEGEGAGAGGGLGAFKNALVRVERADRTVVGSALTDSYGMVSIKDCGGTQSLLVTVQGSSIATYWDEAAQSDLPFPSTESMHAMVAPAAPGQQTLSKNVGISPLTEAAYQYAVAQLGGADAWRNSANVTLANQIVTAEYNRFPSN